MTGWSRNKYCDVLSFISRDWNFLASGITLKWADIFGSAISGKNIHYNEVIMV